MWIVSLWVETESILRGNTTAQAFPWVAMRELCTVRFDKDDMFPGVYAGRIWCRWCTDKLDIDDHMFAIRREVACLEGL
jgi:hypothetical protein